MIEDLRDVEVREAGFSVVTSDGQRLELDGASHAALASAAAQLGPSDFVIPATPWVATTPCALLRSIVVPTEGLAAVRSMLPGVSGQVLAVSSRRQVGGGK